MLLAHIGEELLGRSGASGFHVIVPLSDTSNGFFKVLALPFQVGGLSLVEGVCRGFAAPTSEFF